ncbi:MAG: ABC transporter permease [Bacteroidales bacterium]|nr:ABC transporter permease [Bacteroidales bacterium]MBO7488591.1 ABC transporter permease [Bacteroidales bacterium]
MKLLDRDMWQEVLVTVKGQKVRSILTMFGVFWGIFMLVVLIGCGFGMKKGLIGSLMNLSSNSIVYTPTTTSMAYSGFNADRSWYIQSKDISDIREKMGRRLRYVTLANLDGFQQIGSRTRSGYYQTAGVTPTYYIDIPQKVVYGRYLNDTDIDEHRKVCLAGERVVAELFDTDNPVGEDLIVDGNVYKIVGVITHTNENISVGFFSQDCVLLPFTTEQDAFDHKDHIGMISVGLYDKYDSRTANAEISSILKRNHNIHPDDDASMEIISMVDAVSVYESTMKGVELLILIVGLGTLLAGLIGISNIMLVTIKERTKEIGIRRALGARPRIIILQIMLEALTLTVVAGIAGIIVGTWVLLLLNNVLGGGTDALISRPMIPPAYAFGSLFILVCGGLASGYVPARKALKIKAIEALRDDK